MADRDGNTIYRLSKTVKMSVLAVLPAAKVTVSAALAAMANWPSCVVGTKVEFEAAPTEVEFGPDGTVYVAGQPTLKSGAQALDSIVYVINPTTKRVRTLPPRYAGPVDLAIGTKRQVYVARPDANRIFVIRQGRSSTYLKMAGVESVEVDEKGRLYAVRSAGASPETNPAAVVRIR